MNDNISKSPVFFTPSGCLTADALMLFVSDTLKDSELVKVQQHISECPLCSDAAEGLRLWLKEKSHHNNSISEPTINLEDRVSLVPGREEFDPKPTSQSNDLKPNLFCNRTTLLNERIEQRMHARSQHEPEKVRRMAYKPFAWLAAAASIILLISAGYVLWLQNQHDEMSQAQKLQKEREATLIAQIPENLAFPPSNSNVILDIKYNSEKGSHTPPVVTIVNEDVTLASDMGRSGRNNAAKTDDNAEYTETRQGVESDVNREEYGMYKGQNARQKQTVKNSGGAMQKTETDEETSSVFISVQQMPSFPGGDAARKKYLAKNLRYPTQAAEEGIQGTTYVSFVVKTDGKITNVKLLRRIGGGCDEEAVRVVSKMPQWKPGYQNGKKVNVLYNMPVHFKLN
jgi:TonB family protein